MAVTMQKLTELCTSARSNFSTDHLIIAGGAPRDVLSGVLVKDIDVFVRIPDEHIGGEWFPHLCENFAVHMGGKLDLRETRPEYPGIMDLADIHAPNGLGVIQIVGLYISPIDDVPHYDFGLSQVFVTPTGVFFTESAIKDRQNKTITYLPNTPNEAQQLRSKARLERLRAKYPSWTFAGCEPLDAIPPPTTDEQLLAIL